MLRLIRVHHIEQKLQRIDQLDVDRSAWIVSDLQSKLYLRRRLHQKYKILPDQCVLRASDLWTNLVLAARPDWQLVPSETIQLLILRMLRERPESEVSVHPESLAELIGQYLDQLVSVYAQSSSPSVLDDFFTQNPQSSERWRHWYDLGATAWQEIENSKVFSSKWASSMLLSQPNLRELLDGFDHLYFDLGFMMTPVELELIEKLSDTVDVTVIEPVLPNESRLHVYTMLESLAKETETESESEVSIPDCRYIRMATPLSEVKDVVANVRTTLDRGVKLDALAVVAPNIEDYWPVLSSYLQREGIPAKKATTMRLGTLPGMQVYLSRLRQVSGGVQFSDLEQGHFFHHETPAQRFPKFRYLFENAMEVNDLPGRLRISVPKLSDRMSDADFLRWALPIWPSAYAVEPIEEAVLLYLQQTPGNLELSLADHLNLFERFISRREIVIQKSAIEGIDIVPLFALEYVDAQYVFVMGLTSESMIAGQSTQISFDDVIEIAKSTGFFILHPEMQDLSTELRWFARNPRQVLVSSVADVNFDGVAQSPALYWLSQANEKERETMIVPQKTRWDELHEQNLSTILEQTGAESVDTQLVEHSIRQDVGEEPLEPFVVEGLSFSASLIERYIQCPFLAAASKVFRLEDEQSVDMDLDAAKKGRLMHKLFELIKQHPDEELDLLVDQSYTSVREENDQILQDASLWPMVRGRYLDMGRKFIDLEHKWAESLSGYRLRATEDKIELYFERATKSFTTHETPHQFRGFIDRIDESAEGELMLIDYKSSKAQATHHTKWLEDGKLQLPIYAAMVEARDQKPVVAATYYIVKEERRDFGFVRPEVSALSTRYNSLDQEGQRSLIAEALDQVDQVLGGFEEGQFAPVPKDPNTCQTCRWRKLCRAPHLN